ncbi:MAG: Ig-like domain-containing protein, partial [Clostridia bacterium]|nr:Ig-like domain-containing protein [Clostridia bacterium]
KVKAESTVLWEEDFDNIEFDEELGDYNVSALHPDWTATIGDSDGDDTGTFYARANDATISWSDAATVHGPKVSFEDGKVALKEAKNTGHGGSKAELVIPMTFEGAHPTTGYTVFEFDYYSDSPFVKNRSNEWSYQDFTLTGPGLRHYARVGITTTNGIQDLIDSPVEPNDPEAGTTSYKEAYALAGYYDTFVAGTNKNNIRQGTDLAGKPVKVQIVYDLENMKYMISATVDGTKSFRGNTWMDIPGTVIGHVTEPTAPNVNYFFNAIQLQASEAPVGGATDSVASYDNMKYTHYTVLPEFVSSSVKEGDKDVPVSGTIDLTFSEDIDEASIDGISLKAGNTEADVTVAMDGTDGVTVTYEGLSGNVDYTLTVPETVTNVGGLPISAVQPITFTTEETVPAVTSVTPADNSSNQLLTVAPEVTFSEAVDEETIDGITLSDTYGNVAVTRALSADGKTVTLTPDSSLDAGATYTITVPATVKSLGGIAVTETTATFTTSTGGEVLWSENFDTITAENVMTERPTWTATVGNYSGGSLTSTTFNSSSENWSAAATDYTSKLAFDNGKLVLGQKRNTEHGSENVILNMPFGLSTSTGCPPATGYLIFEYDYYSDNLPIRDRYNERNNVNDLQLYESASARIYAQIDVTSTNGIQDMYNAGTINSADTYNSVNAATKDNVRSAADLQGKNVHMVLVFDVANTQYNIGAKVDGKYTFRSTDWVDYVGNQNAGWFFNKLTLRQNECNKYQNVFSEATYDNFVLTHYTTLPNFVSDNIADKTNVNVAGSFDLTFDTAIDPASIDAISLKADESETAEEIELSMKDSKTVTVSYSGLSKLTPYTLTIPKIVVSNLGLPLSAAGTVSFTTNNIAPPEIENVTITDGATDVLLNKEIAVTLSEAIKEGTEQYITLTKKDEETNLITGYAVSNEDKTVTLAHADFE